MGDRLVVSRISCVMDEGAGFELTFGENERFGLSIDGEHIVTGSAATGEDARSTFIQLCPEQPDWAASRQVRVACTRDADLMTSVTTIGAGP